MHRFTTEFGMGSGGSNALWSSRNSVASPFNLTVNVPANGYVIDVVFCEPQTFGLYRLHTPQSGALSSQQIAWVLYGQASRAISIG